METGIMERQILGDEQEAVLTALAESVARPGGRFLEIGSWCGDTAVILGRVAKKNAGFLVCIDWWKGSPGTELSDIASKKDVYSFFWKRICDEGLEDVVIPVRARSEAVAAMLKESAFDLVFIDGDHTYSSVAGDIKAYSPLVNGGGILCGHDCEGFVSDFDAEFLESGKDKNCHETVHCGVVLSVGEAFTEYSIDYNIWSVRALESGWGRTALSLSIPEKKQFAPPLIGLTKNWKIFRYGKSVYGAPRARSDFDVSDEGHREQPGVLKARDIAALEALAGERVTITQANPVLSSSYRGYNLIRFDDRYYAMSQAIGPVDIIALDESALNKYAQQGLCAIGKDPEEAKAAVDKLIAMFPEMIEEGYKGFNLIAFRHEVFAFSQDLGPFDLAVLPENRLKEYKKKFKCFVAGSADSVKELIDINERAASKKLA